MLDYRLVINKFFPYLEIKTYKVNTDGLENNVVIVNDDLVFRFCKENPEYPCVFEKEKLVTDRLKNHISIPIPKIEIYEDNDVKFTFHKIIKGTSYKYDDADIACDLAKFFAQLHSVKNDFVSENFILTLSDYNFNQSLLNKFLKKYHLEKDFIESVEKFEKFRFDFEDNVVCHNDVHSGNIIVDNGKLSGIIDFGDVVFANYNIDFVNLIKDNARDNYKLCIEVKDIYEGLTGRKVNMEYVKLADKISVYNRLSKGKSVSKERVRRVMKDYRD